MGSCAGQAGACMRACGTAGAGTAGVWPLHPAGPCELVRLATVMQAASYTWRTAHQMPHAICLQLH